jgi:hypothetical protein
VREDDGEDYGGKDYGRENERGEEEEKERVIISHSHLSPLLFT